MKWVKPEFDNTFDNLTSSEILWPELMLEQLNYTTIYT